jgi:hypothetical protein
MLRSLLLTTFLLLLIGAGGCATSGAGDAGPAAAARVRVERWSFDGQPGRRVVTPHYVIYTTVLDGDLISTVGQVMEGALSQYRRLAPEVPVTDQPMECYLFQSRNQWATFTRGKTGADAAVYLQINRGGYTVGDWYVAYFIGDVGTLSVAAHEGWHQYVARHFESRLPPFLEEGLACMFEEVRWADGKGNGAGPLPRWNFSRNRSRLLGLRNAVDAGRLIPLAKLAGMHAGQVVDQPGEQIEAFYAQSWAFAKFLWDGEGGRHRPALRRILTDAAAGALFPGNNSRRTDNGMWDPESAKPLLEHYLGTTLDSLDAAFARYARRLAAEGYRLDPAA